MTEKLTQEYLKECLEYNPETGILIWKNRPSTHFKNIHTFKKWNKIYPGKEAGCLGIYGYRSITICMKTYPSHRLAFLYMCGYIPENDVDHKDCNRDNNKWINLREVSRSCNMQNQKVRINSTSRITGVYFNKNCNKWISHIKILGRDIRLGSFESFQDAVVARYEEEKTNPLWSCSVTSSAKQYLISIGEQV